MRAIRFGLALVFTAGLCGVAGAQDAIEHGRALVVENCSGCHAIGAAGESPHPKAPAFRKLGERFSIDQLEQAFVTSIDTGHPGMPVFDASEQQIDQIVAYIASVME